MMDLPLRGLTILNLIPQRFPIVMVDAILAYTTTTVQSEFEIKVDNLFLQHDILQESGLLEHMAQTVALHTGYSFFIRNEEAPRGYIGAIQKAEIMELPQLGDVIRSKAEILQEFMGVTLVDICTCVNDQIVATAQMKTVIASTA